MTTTRSRTQDIVNKPQRFLYMLEGRVETGFGGDIIHPSPLGVWGSPIKVADRVADPPNQMREYRGMIMRKGHSRIFASSPYPNPAFGLEVDIDHGYYVAGLLASTVVASNFDRFVVSGGIGFQEHLEPDTSWKAFTVISSTWQPTPKLRYDAPSPNVGHMVRTIQEVAHALEPLATVGEPSEERQLVDDEASSAYRVVPVHIPKQCDFKQFLSRLHG